MEEKRWRIDESTDRLNQASEAYYNGREELMSNYEWDAMFDELGELEREIGYVREDSPTRNAGYEESGGQKEEHEFPALSLAKTKQVEQLKEWAGERPVWLSWKLD